MKTFDFFLDQKVTTWMRTNFSIEAEDLNVAVKIAKEKLERGDLDEIGWEEIDDTKDVLRPENNGGETTAEIYNMNERGDVFQVYDNKLDKVENI